jgi:hypothetical protein
MERRHKVKIEEPPKNEKQFDKPPQSFASFKKQSTKLGSNFKKVDPEDSELTFS